MIKKLKIHHRFLMIRIIALILFPFTLDALYTEMQANNVYENSAFTIEQSSQRNIYHAVVRPAEHSIPIGKFHDWIIHLTTQNGEIFIPEQLVVQGGMPGHGHGFPVEPKITRYLENGDFLIEGVKFNMAGDWQIRFGVNGPEGWDTITFPLHISYDQIDISRNSSKWNDIEIAIMKSLSFSELSPPKADPSNRFSSNQIAANLGKKLFFDPQLSRSGKVSCASCHQPDQAFSDGKKLGFGSEETLRHTPSLVGVAHNQWFYWDGRRDSLWAQAVTPIETTGEMDNNRTDVVRYFFSRPEYSDLYKQITESTVNMKNQNRFPRGAGPYADSIGKSAWARMQPRDRNQINVTFSNLGKFLAAYEATLLPKSSRFDRFVDLVRNNDQTAANEVLSETERAGLKLFLNSERTQCLRCHNGPLFTNHGFHNIGTGMINGKVTDYGRYLGMQSVAYDVFNCEGQFSDANADECDSLRFMIRSEIPEFMQGAFKVPSLRNVANTAPYLHDGRFESLTKVVQHYRKPPQEMSEVASIELSDHEVQQLVAFLRTLSAKDIGFP